jgi:cyclopropane fatty-acyl-phospholipid synthase-like methyltransferase
MTDRKQFDNSKELGDWYNRKYVEMGDGWHTPPEEVNRHLNDMMVPYDKEKWLLDVGCGAGHFLQEAVKRVSCVGIELSRIGIAHATLRAPEATLILADIGDGFTLTNTDSFHVGKFDFVVSIGSLEHIVDLPSALDNIHALLKYDGRFYFYCPNELWAHFDQPNEQTKTDKEWIALFAEHGLFTSRFTRWNDNTAFYGGKIPL